MKFFTKHITIVLFSLTAVNLFAQISHTASNGCNCSGSVEFNWQTSTQELTFELTDIVTGFNQIIQSSSGHFEYSSLCPHAYSLQVAGLFPNDTSFFFNISDIASPLPEFSDQIICHTLAGQDDTIDIAFEVGISNYEYYWSGPSNQNIEFGRIHVDDLHSGIYTFTENNSACLKSSAINVIYFNNSAGDETGNLLICESEVDSVVLFSLLGGNPAEGGYWTHEGESFNGIFYPETMEGGVNNRFYYHVHIPECAITDVAPVTITERKAPDPGITLTETNFYCPNAESVNLFHLLGGYPDRGGNWRLLPGINNAAISGIDSIFIPGINPSGIYQYKVIPQLPCAGTYESFVNVEYHPDPMPGNHLDTMVCSNSEPFNVLNAIQAPTNYAGQLTFVTGGNAPLIFNPAIDEEFDLVYSINPFNCGIRSANIHVVSTPYLSAGADYSSSICASSFPIALNDLISADADAGGQWLQSGSEILIDSLYSSSDGFNAIYRIGTEGCESDSAYYNIQIDSPINFEAPATILVCPDSEPINLYNLLGSSQLSITNSSSQAISPVLYAGNYSDQVIHVTKNSGNSCPNISLSIFVNYEVNTINDDSIFFEFCELDLPISLNSLIPLSLVNSGYWENASGMLLNTESFDWTGSTNCDFVLAEQPLCGGSQIKLELLSHAATDGPENIQMNFCQANSSLSLNEILSTTNAGQWFSDGSPMTNWMLDMTSPTQYELEYRIESVNLCPEHITSVLIEILPLPQVNAGQDISICSDDPSPSIGVTAMPGYQYVWSPSNHLSNTNESIVLFNPVNNSNIPQEFAYTLNVTDGSCTNSDSLIVTVLPKPEIVAIDSIDACYGDNVTLSVNTESSYSWAPAELFPDQNQPTQNLTINSSETIYPSVTNLYGCSRTDSIIVTVAPSPTFWLQVNSLASCSPFDVVERIDSCNMDNVNYRWIIPNLDTLFGTSIYTTITESGTYDLLIEAYSALGCKSDTLIQNIYEVYSNPDAEFDGYQENASNLRREVVFDNLSQGAAEYLWSFDGLPTSNNTHLVYDFEGLEPGSYMVCLDVVSEHGCQDSICHSINLVVEEVVFAPTAFTPNADGRNDGFKPIITGFSPEVYEFVIADKWGDIIFKTNNPEEYWLGDVNNHRSYSPNGVYNWMLTAKKYDNAEMQVYRGAVMMIK